MKKVLALLALSALCAVALPLTFVGAQRTGLNPSQRATDAAPPAALEERYVIKFRQFAKFASDDVRVAGGRVVREIPDLGVVAARMPAHVREALSKNPNVELIEVDHPRFPMQTNPPWSDLVIPGTNETTPYGIQMVQADQVSDSLAANRKICIIDSGYEDAHEDLMDSTSGHVTASPNAGTGDPFRDLNSHGTHVAGTIAGLRNGTGVVGVLPSGTVNLHIVKVFGDDGAWAYSSDLAAAVTQCRNAGSNVISMSLGGSFSNSAEQTAFQNAYNAGDLTSAAASSPGTTATSYPAGYSSVVSVAAVDNTELLATFSQRNADVEIAAPGVAVLSSVSYKETNTLTVGGTTYNGNYVEFAARSTAGVSGALADGGLCDTTGGGAFSGKVVLCQRGVISFFDKVRNVQTGGGTAAVIYNNVPGNDFFTLGAGNSSTIPAISLSQADGQAAVAQVGSAGSVVSFVDTAATNGYANFNGTSMATPHVSAVAALVWSYNTAWTNQQIRDAMNATAKDKGTAGRDNSYGFGIVQAKAALTYLQTPPAIPAAPTALVITARNRNFIDLSWTDNSNNETGFKIERCTGATCTNFAQVGTTAANVRTFRSSGLARRTTYRFRVRSFNTAGNSAYSNIVSGATT